MTGYPVIPLPIQVTPRSASFSVDQSTIIALSNPLENELLNLGGFCAAMIADAVGIQIAVSSEPVTGDKPDQIVLAHSSDSAVSSPEP